MVVLRIYFAFKMENIYEPHLMTMDTCLFWRRERRTKFEAQLMSERKKIEVFRLRETKEFLSIDELREKCESSDQFMDILKVIRVMGD